MRFTFETQGKRSTFETYDNETMKHESTVTSSGKDRGVSVTNRPKALQKERFIKGRVMLSIWCDWKSIVFFQGMKRLIRVCTINNWTNYQ